MINALNCYIVTLEAVTVWDGQIGSMPTPCGAEILSLNMKLTRYQIKTLQFFAAYRETDPTVMRQLRFNWFAWLPLLVIAGLAGVLVCTPGDEYAGCVVFGVVMGAFGRDLGRFRVLSRIWPVYREIIRWPRVTELLEAGQLPAVRKDED